MKNIYIINYNDVNYIFISNKNIENKILKKKILLDNDLLTNDYSDNNINKLNYIIEYNKYELIDYEIEDNITIYKLRYIIQKHIDKKLNYINQHITVDCNINYGNIKDILFKIYSELKEVNSIKIQNYYKILGFNIIGEIKREHISYKELEKHLEWNTKSITLGYELIQLSNNMELYLTGEFYNKNIDLSILELFILYNTNNKTLSEYNITNNIIYLYNYYIEDIYKINISELLKNIYINYNDDINIPYNNKLNKVNIFNSNIEYYELHYKNKFNKFNLNDEFNKYELSEIIPFIKIKNNNSEYKYKIFINSVSDIPYIEQSILNTWINSNELIKLNSIEIYIKYINENSYYTIYISQSSIKFIFNLKNKFINIDDITKNINYVLKNILKINYMYDVMNPLFKLKKIDLRYSYIVNNINYKDLYYRLLLLLGLDYENTIIDINYIRDNINKLSNLKTIIFNYKNSINYNYTIEEKNILRDIVSYTQYNKIIEQLKGNNVNDELITIYKNSLKKIICKIEYNNNIYEIIISNLSHYKKINDINILLNNIINKLTNDNYIYNLYNKWNIKNLENNEKNIYNKDISEDLFIYNNFIEKVYNKLNINPNINNDIEDNFFDDLENINSIPAIHNIEEFNNILNIKQQYIILNINSGEKIYNKFPVNLIKYIKVLSIKKDIYYINIHNYNNYNFEMLITILYYTLIIKVESITFVQLMNSQVINFLDNMKKIQNNLEIFISIIILIIDYIKELDIEYITKITHKYLEMNIIEIYLMLLDFEYISQKNIERYNKNIYKKIGFTDYNQYSQICPLDRQPTFINKELYNILLENDTTGSINRIFNNELLSKKISNEYYLCLINNINNKSNLIPIIDNISDNVNSICCHSFDYKQKRKINIRNLNDITIIDFSNKSMLPYSIGNIPSSDIVISIGFIPNTQKYIKNIYDISILLRVGIPINNNFSPFINSLLFILNKSNISTAVLINDITTNITSKIFKKLNNGSLYSIFKHKIINNTVSLESLISMYITSNTISEEVDNPYNNFIEYISNNIKYIDHDIGLHLFSEVYNINIIIFNYNISSIIYHELICPTNNINYNFNNKNTVILLKHNNIYESIISYNNIDKYKYLFNNNDIYFKTNNLLKLINKCKLTDNNDLYYNSINSINPIMHKLDNKDINIFNIMYNVIDNYNTIGFIININDNINDNLFIPINNLIDNITIQDKTEIKFSSMLENKQFIYNYTITLNKLNKIKNLPTQLHFNNKVVIDTLVPNYINAIILNNNNYIPIILSNISDINLTNIQLIENDELYVNNIITNINKSKFNISNSNPVNYNNFKIILNKLFKNNKLNIELHNILLKNNLLILYDYLSNIIKQYNIFLNNKSYTEFISYELLNNYITRFDILEKNIIDNNELYFKENVLVLSDINLKNIGIYNIYKSFYYNNNNLYTGNILTDINLHHNKELICNSITNIPQSITLLKNYYYYNLKYIDKNIIAYSNCIYYNLEQLFKINNLRTDIFNYIINNNLYKHYLSNTKQDTNNIIYNDINSHENLEDIILSNNHWITIIDIQYLINILNINIIIINNLNEIQLFTNINSSKYIILYQYLFYHKKIYYLVCNNKHESIFNNTIVKHLISYSKTYKHNNNYNTTNNTISVINNKYLYNIINNKYSIINILNDNIIDDYDINNIYNEIIDIWTNLPFNYNHKFIDLLKKLSIKTKITDHIINKIITFYPNIEYNEPIIFPPFYHLDYIWNLRTNKQIYNIFKNIYNNNNLIINYTSVSIIINKNPYFKIHNNNNENNNIYGFLCLTSIQLYYINDSNYIKTLFDNNNFKDVSYDHHIEYRINNNDIDNKFINSIKLEPGSLFLYSESLLYNLNINNYILGFVVHINYSPYTNTINSKLRIHAYEHGLSLQNNFNLNHYNINDLTRVFNYFNLNIYPDHGIFLYNNYKDFKKYSPIIYTNLIKQLNEYEPTKILAKNLNKNSILLNSIIQSTLDISINTLYDNNKSYKQLSDIGQQLITGNILS